MVACKNCDPQQSLAQQVVTEVLARQPGSAAQIRATVEAVQYIMDSQKLPISEILFQLVFIFLTVGVGFITGYFYCLR